MFLGYQNGKISFVAETREELESLPCVTLDRIEETDKEYFLHNGEYIFEIPTPTREEVSAAREALYEELVDPITAHIARLRDEEQTEDVIAEIEALKAERAARVAEIKEQNPYPVEEDVDGE